MALSLFRTLDNIKTPCSVNAKGKYFKLDPLPFFKVTNCDLEKSYSTLESSNIKSSGNLVIFLLTDCLSL
jgi:hypothetical protein